MDRGWLATDRGGISLQGVIVFIVTVAIVWGAISMFPLFNVPDTLERDVREGCKVWLRLSPKQQNATIRKQVQTNIVNIVTDKLTNHTYDPKALSIEFVGSRRLRVKLDYTININLFGYKLTFEKKLNVDESAINF